MANTFNINSITLHVGAFNGATEVPLGFIPNAGGGVTVIDCWLYSPGAGTVVGGKIVTMGSVATGGTPAINGTVGAFATPAVTAAGVVHQLTISDAWVDGDEFLGFDQTSGTIPAGSYIQVLYVQGRGS